MTRAWTLMLALPLTLGGCLIPQPDTPPIPPGAPSSMSGSVAAPSSAKRPTAAPEPRAATPTAVASDASMETGGPASASAAPLPAAPVTGGANAGAIAMDPSFVAPTSASHPANMGGRSPEPGYLTVSFTGKVPKEVWLVAVDGTATISPKLNAGGFTLGLGAGDYWLEIVDGDARLRSRTPLSVPAGGNRTLEVAVEEAQLVVEETIALEAQPTAEPSPASTPAGPGVSEPLPTAR